jgi:hypothetical protein
MCFHYGTIVRFRHCDIFAKRCRDDARDRARHHQLTNAAPCRQRIKESPRAHHASRSPSKSTNQASADRVSAPTRHGHGSEIVTTRQKGASLAINDARAERSTAVGAPWWSRWSNAQHNQFNKSNASQQHRKSHEIVFEPMPRIRKHHIHPCSSAVLNLFNQDVPHTCFRRISRAELLVSRFVAKTWPAFRSLWRESGVAASTGRSPQINSTLQRWAASCPHFALM